jgi:hypothetical protein
MTYQSFSRFLHRGLLSVVLLLVVASMTSAQETTGLIVISHTKGAPSRMKLSELKSVMKGERQRWSDGTKVIIFLMKTSTPLGKATCAKVYNMSGDKVKRFWLELSFGGKADPPTFCNSVEDLELQVSQNPGAIGIVDKTAGSPGTKTITIDGKPTF